MSNAPLSTTPIADGRTVIDELPCRVGGLPGEMAFVADRSGDEPPAQPKVSFGPSRAWEGEA